MNTEINPHGDRIIVLPEPKTKQLDSGLIIPDTVKEKPEIGVITHKGPASKNNVGQKIMFNKEVGIRVILDKVEHLMIRDTDVYASL